MYTAAGVKSNRQLATKFETIGELGAHLIRLTLNIYGTSFPDVNATYDKINKIINVTVCNWDDDSEDADMLIFQYHVIEV